MKKKTSLLIMILIMISIFYFSQQSSIISIKQSDFIAKFLNKTSFEPFFFSFTIRKTAHMVIYGLLGVFSYLFFKRIYKASIFVLIYAILDEIHQYYIPGRTCRIEDVCIDFISALSLILLFRLIIYIINRNK